MTLLSEFLLGFLFCFLVSISLASFCAYKLQKHSYLLVFSLSVLFFIAFVFSKHELTFLFTKNLVLKPSLSPFLLSLSLLGLCTYYYLYWRLSSLDEKSSKKVQATDVKDKLLYGLYLSLAFSLLLIISHLFYQAFTWQAVLSFCIFVSLFLNACLLARNLICHNAKLFKLIKILETDKQEYENQIIKLNEQQQQQQDELESQIQERTFELEVTLRELQDTNKELERKSTLDALTGLYNRAYFDKKLLAEYRRSRREQTTLSVIMFDIDHFKKVNDEYGHLAGDDVIRTVAIKSKQVLQRGSDIVCRYGGEEFVIILPNTKESGARKVAEKIRHALAEKPIHSCEGALDIRASFGTASVVGRNELSETDLLSFADQALYQAKNGGRNAVCSHR